MSDKNTEQITKPEETKSSTPQREKDPKKVAAGKRLAEYNRMHREAYEREKKREESKNLEVVKEEESTPEDGQTWIPELSFSTVISIIGVAIAAIDLYMRYRRSSEDHFDWQPVTTVISREPPKQTTSKIPVPIPTQSNEVPKIGMT